MELLDKFVFSLTLNENIADSEQSSHTPSHSNQRYVETILKMQVFNK